MTVAAKPEHEAATGSASPSFKVIGTSPIRHDGVDKVTGRARYGADIRLPGTLYAKVLRSPHAHARILAIDTSRAEALPGVVAVVTAADLPQPAGTLQELDGSALDLQYQRDNFLARDKVLYEGHAVAAVAATDLNLAEEALALIDVQYEVLPAIVDVRAAMADGAPILFESLRTTEMGWPRGDKPTNVTSHIQFRQGDPAQGFANAAVIVEREFRTETVHQGYIEPPVTTALWNYDGFITTWSTTQGSHNSRGQIADALGLPVTRIKVIPTEIGGGFGGKNTVYVEPVAALLSRKAGHCPVKLSMTRAEVLRCAGPTSASYIRVKAGADAAGHITAAQVELDYAAGAYPGSPVGSGARGMFAPYNIPNIVIDGYDVVVNRPSTADYRAPGATNAAFASETVIDELCEKLGMDPIEFRLLNGVKEGDRRIDGPTFRRIGFLETLEATRAHPHYTAPISGPYVGRGVAAGFWPNWGGKSSVSASVNGDGAVSLTLGSIDIGGSRVAIAMQLAEALDIPVTQVKPQVVDSDSVGYNDTSGGSRVTFSTGLAVIDLAHKLIAEMSARLAALWEADPAEVHYQDGVFTVAEHRLTFAEAAAELDADRPIVAAASVHPPEAGPGFAVHIVDVAVDPETGKVSILRYTAAQDVGRAVHRVNVEGQIQGAVVQGIGWALHEEYIYDAAGHLTNPTFLDYRMPTALDLPMLDVVIVEVPNPGHPYGVRGIGEPPIIPPVAAVANAIYAAVGVRLTAAPMTPGRILAALQAKAQAEPV